MHMQILCVTFDLRPSKGHVHNVDMDEWLWSSAHFLHKPIRQEQINLGFTCMHAWEQMSELRQQHLYKKHELF